MGLVLRKMVDKYLSNNNAQTRVGIEGQLAGLWFGPDEYLVEKKGCPYSLIFIKFPSPLNLYPWSKSRTEGLNISTKGLIHLFFTEYGDKMCFYWEGFIIIESNRLYRIPEKARVELTERSPDAELKSFVRSLRSL